jgi:hypothetical protein
MNTKKKSSPESIVREIKRRTRRKYSAEEKIRIVLEGLRGEQSIAVNPVKSHIDLPFDPKDDFVYNLGQFL